MFPQGAHAPPSWGNHCVQTLVLRTRIPSGTLCSIVSKRKSPFHTVCRTGFSGIVTQFPTWSGHLCAKLSLEANESAKSPSPSLAGQSVIVNQAGLLAPVHRSSASSQESLPSDCQPPLAYGITRCYSGVTAPAYTGFPIKHVATLSYSLHLIQYIFSFYVTIG